MFIWCYSSQAMFGQLGIEDNPVIRKRNSMRMKVEGNGSKYIYERKEKQQHGIN